MASDRNLFDLIALSDELRETHGVEVDVLSDGGLSPYLRDRTLSEAVPL
jgi:predicted nucleotidyltransferase